ncbi:MAG: VOC family protein [Rhodospirillaceae bacterium]|nr:VOC family protein [Rhodospirillaceae bacterium]
MRYLHTAVRVSDLDEALNFYVGQMGLTEIKRFEGTKRPCTIVFLAAPGDDAAQIEVVYYHDAAERAARGNFSHIAYQVDDIYAACADMKAKGALIAHPPRDGAMAFVRSPDGISIELLQKGKALPPAEPWASMPDAGEW